MTETVRRRRAHKTPGLKHYTLSLKQKTMQDVDQLSRVRQVSRSEAVDYLLGIALCVIEYVGYESVLLKEG